MFEPESRSSSKGVKLTVIVNDRIAQGDYHNVALTSSGTYLFPTTEFSYSSNIGEQENSIRGDLSLAEPSDSATLRFQTRLSLLPSLPQTPLRQNKESSPVKCLALSIRTDLSLHRIVKGTQCFLDSHQTDLHSLIDPEHHRRSRNRRE